jgi:type I restriction-modification system DNA methylase subunit
MGSRKTGVLKDSAYKAIGTLVNRFEEQFRSYIKPTYKEAQTREDFINPFFKALGWDVDNSQLEAAEAYREVMYEDRIKVGNVMKAPDYSFKLSGGKRLFFVEAKKPSVFVKEEIEPAYQIRSYAWSANLPISILTDFEEFSVYDCSIKPKLKDRADVARVKYLTFNQYKQEFDFLWNTFSKEKVLKGSFDEFVKTSAGKKGTTTIDKDFLVSLSNWRDRLAQNIALRNHSIGAEELNFVVQQTIDRIIFLRIAEDRNLEIYGGLDQCIKEGNYYQNLFVYFQEADKKYNSGLFDFRKDQISKDVVVENRILKSIISELYYPLCPYVFTVIDVEILGNAYEQFLGKRITLSSGHRAKIELTPAVRKAGGVYYTPQPVVQYIVNNSISPFLKGETPATISDLKIADISCGSGSFLLGAYQYLLDWHLDYYTHKANKSQAKRALNPLGQLDIGTKKKILVNHIYGVDIDPQAVEVTKLSLLLKCMEGETPSSVDHQLKLFNERVLPTLDDNIKTGNSLISPDWYERELPFDKNSTNRTFDWATTFPDIFRNGGFHIIVGNPPWGADFQPDELTYFKDKYRSAQAGATDSYAIFIEKSLSLLQSRGMLGIITPDTFLRKDDFGAFRSYLLRHHSVKELIEAGPLFSQVRDTWCSICLIKKERPSKQSVISHKKISRFIVSVEERLLKVKTEAWDVQSAFPQGRWLEKYKMIVGYKANVLEQTLIDKVECYPRLGDLHEYTISRGEEGSKLNIKESDKGDFYMVIPEDVNRYQIGRGKQVYSKTLATGKIQAVYSRPKIWVIRIQKMRWSQRIVSALDERGNSAAMKTLQSITSRTNSVDDLLCLQAIFSSKLINFWCVNYLADDLNQSYLSKIPIPSILSKTQKHLRYQIIEAASKMMRLQSDQIDLRVENKKEEGQRMIASLDRTINKLIYRLYDLNEEEIAIVESDESVSLPTTVEAIKGKNKISGRQKLKSRLLSQRSLSSSFKNNISSKEKK